MKATVKVEKQIDIASILVDINCRYVGDGDDDDVPSDFPLLSGSIWRASIDVDSGVIAGWPAGESRHLYTKVCDEGAYTLYDREGGQVARIDGYVPNGIVPGEYGDYVDLMIDADGRITNWPSEPDISEFFEE